MKRELEAFAQETLDALVVGGGIAGACIAWDAALRGLAVGLVERGDFGEGTSWNTLKVIHGGLRHLQRLDLQQMRDSARERSAWLRIAPHLVEPLPVVVPTYRRSLQSRFLLRTAAAIGDLVAWDRNHDLDLERLLPPARILSRNECCELVPEYESPDLTGGILFYDAQMYSAERLVLEVIQAAEGAGAFVANYAELEGVVDVRDGVVSASVRDNLAGGALVGVRARILVNATGPSSSVLAAKLVGGARRAGTALALNVIVPARGHQVAFSVVGPARDPDAKLSLGRRQFFFVPWRGQLLIGTGQWPYTGNSDRFVCPPDRMKEFLDAVNTSWPGTPFDPEEVAVVHAGLLPAVGSSDHRQPRLLRRGQILDHASEQAPWLVSVITPKFTSARRVAEGAVDLIFGKLQRTSPDCRTMFTQLPGAPQVSVRDLIARANERYGTVLEAEVLGHLARSYGSQLERIMAYRHSVTEWNRRIVDSAPVIRAQWVHGAVHEGAEKPEDLVFRRTELGARGLASEEVLEMASEVLHAKKVGRA